MQGPTERSHEHLFEKGTKEDEMVEWHHQLHGHEFEQARGVDDGQGSLECCSYLVGKEAGMYSMKDVINL